METKKSKKADLERYRGVFVEIGLVFALAVLIVAFNWSSSGETKAVLQEFVGEVEEEVDVPITEEVPPPPPEQIEVPMVSDEMLLVDNDMEIESTNLFSSEDDSRFALVEVPYVEGKQVEEEEVFEEDIMYDVVQEKPLFMGGDANNFSKWVSGKVVYPTIAQENGVQGKVFLTFRIAADGSLTDIKVLRGVDPSLDKEAVRVVSSSPKWTPGRQHNKAVPVRYTFPVNFTLAN
ncbi:MAG: energy transducer TonB [Prevotellaceae bacterium]|jgi:protein TonB|nr:energy transducer TonB [Prevotellaceae bacterium]